MRIATFKLKDGPNSAPRAGLVAGDSVLDLTALPSRGVAGSDRAGGDTLSIIRSFQDLRVRIDEMAALGGGGGELPAGRYGLDRVKLCAPVERPGKIICLAGNYREHITESGYAAPAQADVITQQLFLKPSTCITGDGEEIVIEHNNVTVGWETELAVVIGRRGKHIPAGDAYDHVFGYTILNDVSERG